MTQTKLSLRERLMDNSTAAFTPFSSCASSLTSWLATLRSMGTEDTPAQTDRSSSQPGFTFILLQSKSVRGVIISQTSTRIIWIIEPSHEVCPVCLTFNRTETRHAEPVSAERKTRSAFITPDSNCDRHVMCPLKTGREPIRFRALWLLAGVWDECRIHQPTLSISDSLGDFYFSHARDVIDTKITEMLRSPTGVWRDGQF